MLFPTTLVGSYPQPEWLIDRAKLAGRFPPRVRATRAVAHPEPNTWTRRRTTRRCSRSARRRRPGIDIITDGEIRRESYSNRFATALDGVDLDNPGHGARSQRPPEPGAARRGPIRRRHAVRWTTCGSSSRTRTRPVKITVPGPFTMSQQAQNDYYGGSRETGGAGLRRRPSTRRSSDLFAAGADIVQIDEPYMQARPDEARAVRPRGAEPRARGRHRHDRGAHLLRLRRDHPRAARRLFVPAGAGRLPLPADLDRDRAVEPRLPRARAAAGQEDHPRRDRPVDARGRDAGGGRRPHPPRAAARRARRTSSSRRTAA